MQIEKILGNKVREHQLAVLKEFATKKPVPIGELANSLGVSVYLSTLGVGLSGLIESNDTGYRIKINRYDSRERQRFTIAHEISHFLLHRNLIDQSGGIEDNVLYRSSHSDNVEIEANKLAAELLLPLNLFSEDVNSIEKFHSLNVEELADAWQVSKAVMQIRLKEVLGHELSSTI